MTGRIGRAFALVAGASLAGLAAAPLAAAPVVPSLAFPSAPAVAPRPVTLPAADYPAAERDAGHNGMVEVAAGIDEEGRIAGPVTVTAPSGAATLDALALAATRAATFTPARDAAGAAVEVPVRLTFLFGSYASAAPGSGFAAYRCAELVRDADWWRSAFPERKWSDFPVYAQLFVAPLLRYGHAIPMAAIVGRMHGFPAHWQELLAVCRTRPEARLADTIQPEGALIDRLWKDGRWTVGP